MNPFRRFFIRFLSAALVVLLMSFAVPVAGAASARNGLHRIYGATRYETAYAASNALTDSWFLGHFR